MDLGYTTSSKLGLRNNNLWVARRTKRHLTASLIPLCAGATFGQTTRSTLVVRGGHVTRHVACYCTDPLHLEVRYRGFGRFTLLSDVAPVSEGRLKHMTRASFFERVRCRCFATGWSQNRALWDLCGFNVPLQWFGEKSRDFVVWHY